MNSDYANQHKPFSKLWRRPTGTVSLLVSALCLIIILLGSLTDSSKIVGALAIAFLLIILIFLSILDIFSALDLVILNEGVLIPNRTWRQTIRREKPMARYDQGHSLHLNEGSRLEFINLLTKDGTSIVIPKRDIPDFKNFVEVMRSRGIAIYKDRTVRDEWLRISKFEEKTIHSDEPSN